MATITPLLNTEETAARIRSMKSVRLQNALLLRRLRGVPLARTPFNDMLLIHRSAFACMARIWYQFLLSENGQAPPTADELSVAKDNMQESVIMGMASIWYMNNLAETPYNAVAPYCLKVIQEQIAREARFVQRLDNGQQWLSHDERECYNHVRPFNMRRGPKTRYLFGEGIKEAVWNVYDYAARMLGEHHVATGRTVTPAEFAVIASDIKQKMLGDAYQSAVDNVDRSQFDILGTAPFSYSYNDAGQLTAVHRQPISTADLTQARQDPEVRAMYERQSAIDVATGCPVVHAKLKPAGTPQGMPNNYVPYLLDETLAAIKKAVFEPDFNELRLFWRPHHSDNTGIPNGKADNRPAPATETTSGSPAP